MMQITIEKNGKKLIIKDFLSRGGVELQVNNNGAVRINDIHNNILITKSFNNISESDTVDIEEAIKKGEQLSKAQPEACESKKHAGSIEDVIDFITTGKNKEIFLYGAYPISRSNDVQITGDACAEVQWTRPSFVDAKNIIECEFENVTVSLKEYGHGYSTLEICAI
jgi:hypothetical protein